MATLRMAGVDLSRCQRSRAPLAHCVLIHDGDAAWGASSTPPEVNEEIPEHVLDGVSHLVVCPRWGRWAESLILAARRRDILCSLVGMAPPERSDGRWHIVVAETRQIGSPGDVEASFVAVTEGSLGSRIHVSDGRFLKIPAVRAREVDPTGAGDVYAGTLIARLERGDRPYTAGTAAAEAAARAVESWGAQTTLVMSKRRELNADRKSRVRGALWGLACGDAFGMPNSFLRSHPWISEFLPGPPDNPYHAGYPAARITDDTEQALALTAALEAKPDGVDARLVANQLVEWFKSVGGTGSKAVGPSTLKSCLALMRGKPVEETGRQGTTNGGAMRIAPVGVFAGLRGEDLPTIVEHTVGACMPTHHTGVAIAGAAAVAAAVAAGVSGKDWEEIISSAIEAAELGNTRGEWVCAPSVARRIEWAVSVCAAAQDPREAAELATELVGAGVETADSVPAAFGVAAFARGDPRLAIEVGGNLVGDTDTVAAMAGAVCGSWAGEGALPAGWRERVAKANGLDVREWAERLEAIAKISGTGGLAR